MPTMIDTSVWIDFLRGYATPQVGRLKALLGEEDLLIGDLILAEILQGIRDDHDVLHVEAAFAPYPVVPLVDEAIARQSARYYRHLRKQGITVRKTIDCLIATWCIMHRVPLLYADRDFAPFVMLGLVEA